MKSSVLAVRGTRRGMLSSATEESVFGFLNPSSTIWPYTPPMDHPFTAISPFSGRGVIFCTTCNNLKSIIKITAQKPTYTIFFQGKILAKIYLTATFRGDWPHFFQFRSFLRRCCGNSYNSEIQRNTPRHPVCRSTPVSPTLRLSTQSRKTPQPILLDRFQINW